MISASEIDDIIKKDYDKLEKLKQQKNEYQKQYVNVQKNVKIQNKRVDNILKTIKKILLDIKSIRNVNTINIKNISLEMLEEIKEEIEEKVFQTNDEAQYRQLQLDFIIGVINYYETKIMVSSKLKEISNALTNIDNEIMRLES